MNKRLIMAGLIIALFFCTPNLFALSPEIRFDMLKTKLAQQLKSQEFSGALETMDEIKALGIPLPSSLDYFEGKALFESGQKYDAYIKLENYVEQNGKSAKYYNQAIAYLVKAEDTYNAENKKREKERIAREIATEEARIAREQAKKEARLAAEKRAQEEREKEVLLRKEAEEFSALPQIASYENIGLKWTMPVSKKYRDNPYLPVKTYGTKQEAKSYCENLVLGNHDDWSVPTLKEFSTISDDDWGEKHYSTVWVQGSPEFSNGDNPFVENQLYPIENGKAYTSNKSRANIMCVRTDSKEKFDDYFKHKVQIIEHKDNKIMVEDKYMISGSKCYFVDPSITFESAAKYCKDLTLGGYDDWRVPTRKDMLERLPCRIAEKVYFLRDDPDYNDLWYGSKSLFSQKVGYLDQADCKIRSARVSDHHKIRCVREVGEKKAGTQQNTPPLDVDDR